MRPEIEKLITTLCKIEHGAGIPGMGTTHWPRNPEGEEASAIIRAQAERIAGLDAALTPSASTKAAYWGEFKFNIYETDENGEDHARSITVPWTTIKDIMKAIRASAAATPPDEPEIEK